jgi:hypothetical protein
MRPPLGTAAEIATSIAQVEPFTENQVFRAPQSFDARSISVFRISYGS